MRLRTLFASVSAALLLLPLAACGDDGGDGGDDVSGPNMTRIAQARAFQNARISVPHETPQSLGEALAKLEPTWVTGLVRIQKSRTPADSMVSGYKTIHDIVVKQSPDAQFDVVLNALDFTAPAQVQNKMANMREKFDLDGWFFDFLTPAYDKRPEVVKAAIADAHEHGEFVGGNAFGWGKKPKKFRVPPDLDFLAVSDTGFRLDLSAVRTLAKKVPIVFHLANSPGNVHGEGCTYIKRYSSGQRVAYVRRRARQQSHNHFHFAYPTFFPTCHPGDTAFNIIREPRTFRGVRKVMGEYN